MRVVGDVAVRPRDPAAVAQQAHDIVSQAQFRHPPSLLHRFITWLGHLLGGGHPTYNGGGSGSGGLSIPATLIFGILAVVLGVVAWLLIRSGALRRQPRAEEDDTPAVHESTDDLGVEDDEWLRRAAAAEAAGEWREGVRCRYRSLVALLAAKGVVIERVGRTAGSYRARVDEALPAAAQPFGAATEVFERTWYGREVADGASSAAITAARGPIEAAAPRHLPEQAAPGSAGARR